MQIENDRRRRAHFIGYLTKMAYTFVNDYGDECAMMTTRMLLSDATSSRGRAFILTFRDCYD